MALGIDGLVSGLDTTSLINSLMQAEAAPQTQLKSQLSSVQSSLTDLQSLNTAIKSIADAAAALTKPAGLQFFSTTSSSSAVTATAGSDAAAGSISFSVDRLASSQVSVTAALGSWPSDPPQLTLVGSDGIAHEVTAASSSIADVVAAINGAKTGVTAVQVAAGTVGGQQQYRIQLTSATGAAGAFTIYQGSAADVTAGTATDLLTQPGSATVSRAQDAQLTLWDGSAAAQTVTSSGNSFTDLLPGVDVTVSATTTSPATVTVARDDAKAAAKFGSLMSSLIQVFAGIAAKSTVSQTTNSDGTAGTSAGSFTGDGTVRDANDRLFTAVSFPVGDITPSQLGITITRDGTFTFDADALTASLQSDPEGITAAMRTLTGRVADAATGISDPDTGSLTAEITGDQATVKQLSDSISDWDDRLTDRRATLEKTYAALETQLSSMQSQSSWLTSQLGGLSGGGK